MKLSVRVPATIANLGPGFDVFALALQEPYETVTVTTRPSERLSLELISKGKYKVPTEPQDNTAGIAALKYLKDFGIAGEFVIEIDKGIRPGGGLGSSAASAAGALYALDSIYCKVDSDTLIQYASYGETVSSGTVHHDNVSASILGGLVVNDGHQFLKVPAGDLPIAVATPSVELKTSDSRKVLGNCMSFSEMRNHISSSTLLLHAFLKGDARLIGRFVNSDNVVEKRRASLISGYTEVKQSALKRGAYGVSISGSGPSVFAIAPEEMLEDVSAAMSEAFLDNGLESTAVITKSSDTGSLVIG